MLVQAITIILALGLIGAAVGLAVALAGLEAALASAERRGNRLRAFNGEALRLAEARGRMRRRQRRVERAVDVGTIGVEAAHRTVAEHTGHADRRGTWFYDGFRRLNRSLGRGLSNWLAPRSKPKRRESLGEWREHHRRGGPDE